MICDAGLCILAIARARAAQNRERRLVMRKIVRCGDLMPGCDCTAVIEGKDDAEVMAKAAEHAKAAHGIMAIPPEVAAKIQAVIKLNDQ
ncbi:MAG: DUF1059 domain-containing protein [Nitrospiria bacterium]